MNGPNLGRCCCCEGTAGVRTIIMLDRPAPEPGTGWGCVVCGLPLDGAIVVVCDACLEANRPYHFACHGYPGQGRRAPLSELPAGRFEHDMTRHAAEEVPG